MNVLDQIAALQSEHREHPSADLERELLRLRHDALAHLQEAGEVRSPAAAAEPRFLDDSSELPSLDPASVTAETVRGSVEQFGCARLSGLLDATTTSELVEGIDRAIDAQERFNEGASPAVTTPWFEPFEPSNDVKLGLARKQTFGSGGMWLGDSPRMFSRVIELLEDAGMVSLLTEYLGERPALSVKKSVLRRVPVNTIGLWHQDGAFLGSDIRVLNLWIALTDCGVDSPGLDLVPQRVDRLLPTGTEGALLDWDIAPAVVDEAAGTQVGYRPELHAGDAFLFDHLFVHRSGADPATMTRVRYALELWCFAPSRYPEHHVPIVL